MTRFLGEIGSVSLDTMIAHAYEIERSDPTQYPDLIHYPNIREDALSLIAAHRMGAPEADLVEHAHRLNRTLKHVREAKSAPKGDKPTVGKASDRLGEKQRRAEEKAARRAEKRKRAKASSRPTGALLGGGQ